MSRFKTSDLELIRDTNRFNAIAKEWSQLWHNDPLATPFQSPEWLMPWWNNFAEGDLFVLALRRNHRLIALIPFYIFTDSENGKRQLLLLGTGTSDYLDGLFANEPMKRTGADVLDIVCECIRNHSTLWDVAYLQQLRSESPLLGLSEMLSPCSQRTPSEACSVLLTAEHQLPPKIAKNISYYLRKAQLLGKLEFRPARKETALSIFESLIVLHERRWQTQAKSGVFADKRVRQHHREAIPLLYHKGLLRLYILLLEGKVIAVFYGLADPPHRSNGRFYYYLSGFDPEYHFLSPGTLLLALVMDAARKEGKVAIDLLRGGEQYKKLWGTRFFQTYALEFRCPQSL
jgi:CelD/BcsL family acetyltransferase involved in cellulose biosynthesis